MRQLDLFSISENKISEEENKKYQEITPEFSSEDIRAAEEVDTKTEPIPEAPALVTHSSDLIFDDGKIAVKIKAKKPVSYIPEPAPVVFSEPIEKIQAINKKGRTSTKEDFSINDLSIPSDEELFSKQYYSIGIVAEWFEVNPSLLRFWEAEFAQLKPRKNRKGDRLFSPKDIKTLQLIYYLLRQKKYTIEGAKDYLKNNRSQADNNLQYIKTLTGLRTFLFELSSSLEE